MSSEEGVTELVAFSSEGGVMTMTGKFSAGGVSNNSSMSEKESCCLTALVSMFADVSVILSNNCSDRNLVR